MKKTLVIALALLMCFSLFAQGSSAAPAEKKATKIGFVVIGSENDQGYTYNFMNGMNAAIDKLKADGYDVELTHCFYPPDFGFWGEKAQIFRRWPSPQCG